MGSHLRVNYYYLLNGPIPHIYDIYNFVVEVTLMTKNHVKINSGHLFLVPEINFSLDKLRNRYSGRVLLKNLGSDYLPRYYNYRPAQQKHLIFENLLFDFMKSGLNADGTAQDILANYLRASYHPSLPTQFEYAT